MAKGLFKGLVILGTFLGVVSTAKLANAGSPSPGSFQGYANGATSADTTEVTVRPVRPLGSLVCFLDDNGHYIGLIPPNISPPVRRDDTLDFYTHGPHGKIRTWRTADSLANVYKNLQTFENGHAGNVLDVVDHTGLSGDITARVSFDGQSDFLVVKADPTKAKYTALAANLKSLLGFAHGAPYTALFTKQGAVPVTVHATADTTKGDAEITAARVDIYPVSGVEERVQLIKPGIFSGPLKCFDVKGGYRGTIQSEKDISSLGLGSGVYFLRYADVGEKSPVRKIVITK